MNKGTDAREGGVKRIFLDVILGVLCVSAVSLCAGCVTTRIHVRTPADIAIVRAMTSSGKGVEGAQASLAADYFKAQTSKEQTKAMSQAASEAVAAVAGILAPWTVISTVVGQVMQAVREYNNAESFDWQITDGEDRLTGYEADLKYDVNDHYIFHVKAQFAPKVEGEGRRGR